MASRQHNTPKIRVTQIDDGVFPSLISASREYRRLTEARDALLAQHDWKLRFFGFIDIGGPKDCWEWRGHRQKPSGHGRFQTSTFEKSGAHQIAYLLLRGPIPEGLVVCHSCDNPPCCNPNHLWLGTQAQNQLDSWNKGRRSPPPHPQNRDYMRGELHHNATLTAADVKTIRQSTKSATELGSLFGVSHRTVSAARLGVTWQDVEALPRPHGHKLSPADVHGIKARLAGGERPCDLAKEFGVSPNTISQIKSGLRWGHIS
jgi:hypothetical protein